MSRGHVEAQPWQARLLQSFCAPFSQDPLPSTSNNYRLRVLRSLVLMLPYVEAATERYRGLRRPERNSRKEWGQSKRARRSISVEQEEKDEK
jgi:hypothetical protein